jgi:hypothetical protein
MGLTLGQFRQFLGDSVRILALPVHPQRHG